MEAEFSIIATESSKFSWNLTEFQVSIWTNIRLCERIVGTQKQLVVQWKQIQQQWYNENNVHLISK